MPCIVLSADVELVEQMGLDRGPEDIGRGVHIFISTWSRSGSVV